MPSHFGSSEDVTRDDLFKTGCKVIVSLYGGNIDTSNLNVLHHVNISKISSANKEYFIARLPATQCSEIPSTSSAFAVCYLTKNLYFPISALTLWDWQLVDGEIQPILTELSPALDKLNVPGNVQFKNM